MVLCPSQDWGGRERKRVGKQASALPSYARLLKKGWESALPGRHSPRREKPLLRKREVPPLGTQSVLEGISLPGKGKRVERPPCSDGIEPRETGRKGLKIDSKILKGSPVCLPIFEGRKVEPYFFSESTAILLPRINRVETYRKKSRPYYLVISYRIISVNL